MTRHRPKALRFEQLESKTVLDARWDFGNAMALTSDTTAGAYPTTLARDGARHLVSTALMLGGSVGGETDANALDSNDGVLMPAALTRSGTTQLSLLVAGDSPTARLDAWVDFNRDGDWSDAHEMIFSDSVAAGWNWLQIQTPSNARLGDTYARFRLSASPDPLPPYGPANAGEVEDYAITILAAEPDSIIQLDAESRWQLYRNDGSAFVTQAWPELYQRQTWTPLSIGDFSGDGATDILGVEESGQFWMLMNGGSQFVGSPWGRLSNSVTWTERYAGDYDGDGDLDLMAYEPEGGTWWLARNNGSRFINSYWGRLSTAAAWTDFFPGDFNQDGRPDILAREQTGTWWLAENTGSGFRNRYLGRFAAGVVWQDTLVGDFNGDGWPDVTARSPDGTWWLWRGSPGRLETAVSWGKWTAKSNWNDVVTADMDDDGIDDLLGRDGSGTWWLLRGGAQGFRSERWGRWSNQVAWSQVFVGRFDTDPLLDLIGRASDGTWWLARNTGQGFANRFWGRSLASAAQYVAVVPNFVEPLRLDSGILPEEVPHRSYGDYAREVIDNLMLYGTDRYGESQSSLLMNVIDVRSRSAPQNPLPLDSAFRVIRPGRRGPGGGNLYLDQPTVRAIQLLADLTGETAYADFAAENLRFATSLVDDRGLFWWGWHRYYDAYADEPSGNRGDFHELQIQQPLWEELWQVDPAAVTAEINGIWQWHIVDKSTGESNRHDLTITPPRAFAHSAGEYIYAFAFLYTKTGNRLWLERAKLVADYYWQARNPETNLIPFIPNKPGSFDSQHSHTGVMGMYARALLSTYELTGELSFRDQAVAILRAYATYGYDEVAGKYWASLSLDGKPVVGPRVTDDVEQQYEPRGYIDLWQPYASGKEFPLATAQTYALAYELTGDADLLLAARRWAQALREAFPADQAESNSWYGAYSDYWAEDGTYAENYGRLISFTLHMEQLTGESSYRDFATRAANEAIAQLYYRGFLRGHHAKPYYESMDGVGYLLAALLQLQEADTGSPGRPENF
jgi:hypothetical protein